MRNFTSTIVSMTTTTTTIIITVISDNTKALGYLHDLLFMAHKRIQGQCVSKLGSYIRYKIYDE